MRKEYINYLQEVPINVSLLNIEGYPLHWHDSIEILYVLEGKIKVTIETEIYEVESGELEIINCDEAHSYENIDGENKVLMFQIDPNFFEKYFNDIRSVFFYTNSSEEGAQEEEKYHILRRYLSIILCELIQKGDKYEDYIEDTLVELLYHLINDFHQLIYEKEDLKENEEQFERYDRIVRYIYNNYKDKISLQDIAKKEYLSSYYLSHEIKNTVGYGFKDFLNLTRVEESVKLLLDSDKTVSEISEELGFSHIRYFNKHFKKHYMCTPLQYRKKYKVDDDTLEKMKKTQELDVKEALEYILLYLEDYDRFNYEDRIFKINIDASAEGEEFEEEFNDFINLGDARDLLKEKQRTFITAIQNDMEFKYALIDKVFSEEMGVAIGHSEFYNWQEVRRVIAFLLSINLRPFIILEKSMFSSEGFDALKSFIKFFRELYGDYEIGKWRIQLSNIEELEGLDQLEYIRELKELLEYHFELVNVKIDVTNRDAIYDTSYMIPYIIENTTKGNGFYFKAFDQTDFSEDLNNELFMGDNGIITQNGIRKPSYYAYYLLSKLGNVMIEKGEGYIVTKSGDDIQILLYTYNEDIDKIISFHDILKRRGSKNIAERNFSLNIINLIDDYTVTKYEINETTGSIYNYWINFGRPSRINDEELELLRKASFPSISFSFAKKSSVFNIVTKVKGYGAILFELKRVQKYNY
ncbi:helix-turn-helix domain-containing protein [Clostridium amazonitimonense]|uniref:helix-turn-helix domain-containing protein n=1 Tax=Clostridium amazonitimonense TaxID=1499689 RepID=UPI000509480A|nr:helix-turn-helix domain-containing protein [Clostridium amazonitimonense]